MARVIKIVSVLILLCLDLPAIVLILLFWPVPQPPLPPAWRPAYDTFTAAGDTEHANEILQAALMAEDAGALTYCSTQTYLGPCGTYGGAPEDLEERIKAAEARTASEAAARRYTLRDAIFHLTTLEERFHERRQAGLRFALTDGWLYTRCVHLMTRVPLTSDLVAQTLTRITGKDTAKSAYASALETCERRSRTFGAAIEAGDYGAGAKPFAYEWRRD